MDAARDAAIRERRAAGEAYAAIARDYGLSRQQVCNICREKPLEDGSKESTELYRFLSEDCAFLTANGKKSKVPLKAYNLVWRAWTKQGRYGFPTIAFLRGIPQEIIAAWPGAGSAVSAFILEAQERGAGRR